ncbi:MAG: D-cysteine desulfhydrase family protein [Clostridiaceae bacterium]
MYQGKAVKKLDLANLPTRIQKLEWVSRQTGKNVWIKRDDQTGLEYSGNKIRKLEYALAQALELGCDTIVTAGGIQSNHCRATAAACARLGLRCVLVLSSDEKQSLDGNYLLDVLFGARIRFISSQKYKSSLSQMLDLVVDELKADSKKPYVIPVGASNGIGTYGYFSAMTEIVEQENEMDQIFDTIVATVGSGGTYAGLALANQALGLGKEIIGFNICDDKAYFEQKIQKISQEFMGIYGVFPFETKDIKIIDGYVGRGYALSDAIELDFIQQFAKREGIILDPTYTGKAMRGLVTELIENHPLLSKSENILFIHTGGIFGLFPKRFQF